MSLIPDWQLVLRYAWSIRLLAFAGLLTGFEAVLTLFPDLFSHWPRGILAVVTFLVVLGAFGARLIAQASISGGDDE